MKYSPGKGLAFLCPIQDSYKSLSLLDENGFFDGQTGYGYISLEKFIDAARRVTGGVAKASDFEGKGLPTVKAV